jgi:hypothetical protein
MKAKFQNAKIRESLKKCGSQATIILQVNRNVIATDTILTFDVHGSVHHGNSRFHPVYRPRRPLGRVEL